MKRVIITGATGAIGIALVKSLLQHGIEVLAISRRNSKRICELSSINGLKIVELNMDEIEELPSLIDERDYDVFYHLAWFGSDSSSRGDYGKQLQNISYIPGIVKTAKIMGCQTIIGAGSQAEYGLCNGCIDENHEFNPYTAYGMTKNVFGKLLKEFSNANGLRFNWVRIFSVFGPGMGMDSIITSSIRSMMNGDIFKSTEGIQIWDFLYSEDAAEALRLVGTLGRDSETYCLGSGSGRTIKSYLEEIKSLVDPEAIIEYGAIPYNENSVMELVANIDKIKKDTGFAPQCSFEYGIKQLIEWMKNG